MKPNDESQYAKGTILIDARGHKCPVPTLKLRKQVAQSRAGTLIILLSDDAMAQIDIPHYCNNNNCLLLSIDKENETFKFAVQCQT